MGWENFLLWTIIINSRQKLSHQIDTFIPFPIQAQALLVHLACFSNWFSIFFSSTHQSRVQFVLVFQTQAYCREIMTGSILVHCFLCWMIFECFSHFFNPWVFGWPFGMNFVSLVWNWDDFEFGESLISNSRMRLRILAVGDTSSSGF